MVSRLSVFGFLRLILCILLVGMVLGIAPVPAHAATFTVTTTADMGAGSLRDAITAAQTAAGLDAIVFTVSGTILLGSTLPTITTPIIIDGTGQTITVSGGSLVRVMNVAAGGDLTVINLTIDDGNVTGDGGGINNAGTLTIVNSTLSNNSATRGGGVFNTSGTLTITNSTFSNNSSASFGGAVFNVANTIIANSTIAGNSATSRGGGIISEGGMTITNSTIAGNSANQGGGIFQSLGSMTITNSTITSNSVTDTGGGVLNLGGTMTITNSTITGNSAATRGGGIFDFADSVTINNSIVANNTSALFANCLVIPGGTNNLEFSTTGQCPGVTQTTNPLLGGLANNGGPTQTMALGVGSAAVNNAAAGLCPAQDQGYFERNGTCDIGAFEFQGTAPQPLQIVKTFSPTTIPSGGTSTLTLTLTNPNTFAITILLSDTLPTGITYTSPPATTCTPSGRSLLIDAQTTRAYLTGIPANSTCTIILAVSGTTPGNYPNTATANVLQLASTVSSNTAILVITAQQATPLPQAVPPTTEVGIVDPTIVKLGNPTLALPGETVVFSIMVTNNGAAPATNVVVTDPVPDVFQVTGASTNQGTFTINGNIVTFTIGTLNPAQVINMTITTRVRSDTQPPLDAVNMAFIDFEEGVRHTVSATIHIVRGILPSTGQHSSSSR